MSILKPSVSGIYVNEGIRGVPYTYSCSAWGPYRCLQLEGEVGLAFKFYGDVFLRCQFNLYKMKYFYFLPFKIVHDNSFRIFSSKIYSNLRAFVGMLEITT